MKKVLIAEDDMFIAQAYKTKLETKGAEVMIAEDGGEAIEILKKFTPDVIVLDLVMPKQDGYDTLKLLRANDKYKKIKIIVATNLSQEEELKKAKDAGADECLIKSDTGVEKMAEMVLG
ncbi:response regulator [Candidatus Microgenomates bacterium]|nr:response regulator [Candidatus Microgenomates bacterium CPR3]RIK51353.1 MAG: response regulator [Candidatus Microgenomates bacterium]